MFRLEKQVRKAQKCGIRTLEGYLLSILRQLAVPILCGPYAGIIHTEIKLTRFLVGPAEPRPANINIFKLSECNQPWP